MTDGGGARGRAGRNAVLIAATALVIGGAVGAWYAFGDGAASREGAVTAAGRSVEWVGLPAGTLQTTRPAADGDPEVEVNLAAFDLARTETTVGQYRACVEAGACSAPVGNFYGGEQHPDTEGALNWGVEGRDDHPINGVTWSQATAFCGWIGARLPTGDEWEYAARSAGRTRRFPWGDEPASCEHAVMDVPLAATEDGAAVERCTSTHTAPVCSRPAGNSAQGVCDLIGNVWEWLADTWEWGYPLEEDRRPETRPRRGAGRGTRGGSWDGGPIYHGVSDRYYCDPEGGENSLGFRCARGRGADGPGAGGRRGDVPLLD